MYEVEEKEIERHCVEKKEVTAFIIGIILAVLFGSLCIVAYFLGWTSVGMFVMAGNGFISIFMAIVFVIMYFTGDLF